MRAPLIASCAVVLSVVAGSPARALEKTPVRAPDESGNEWNAGSSYTIAYYNTCQGWIWVWAGFSPGDQIGTCVDYCDGFGTALGLWLFTEYTSPSGYGFTGTISIRSADGSCCPVNTLASQPWLPQDGWNFYPFLVGVQHAPTLAVLQWAAPPCCVAVSRIGSDRAAAGATGPPACGTCYPTTRVTRSFYYGPAGQTLCPGTRMNDGLCDVEWMIDFVVGMCKPVSVDASSWGQVKALYR